MSFRTSGALESLFLKIMTPKKALIMRYETCLKLKKKKRDLKILSVTELWLFLKVLLDGLSFSNSLCFLLIFETIFLVKNLKTVTPISNCSGSIDSTNYDFIYPAPPFLIFKIVSYGSNWP